MANVILFLFAICEERQGRNVLGLWSIPRLLQGQPRAGAVLQQPQSVTGDNHRIFWVGKVLQEHRVQPVTHPPLPPSPEQPCLSINPCCLPKLAQEILNLSEGFVSRGASHGAFPPRAGTLALRFGSAVAEGGKSLQRGATAQCPAGPAPRAPLDVPAPNEHSGGDAASCCCRLCSHPFAAVDALCGVVAVAESRGWV